MLYKRVAKPPFKGIFSIFLNALVLLSLHLDLELVQSNPEYDLVRSEIRKIGGGVV